LVSCPPLWILISIKTVLFNFPVIVHQLVFSIIEVQNNRASSVISLAMVSDWNAIFTWDLFAEQALPGWRLIFSTHWALDWSLL
jgi:hypothetical protein